MLVGESSPCATSSTASVSSCKIGPPPSGPHPIMVELVDPKNSTTAMLATTTEAATITDSANLVLIFKSIFVSGILR